MARSLSPLSIAVVGSNISLGQTKDGTQGAYSWLKEQGLFTHLKERFHRTFDAGVVDELPCQAEDRELQQSFPFKIHNFASICTFNQHLASKISQLNEQFDLTLNIGGDHSSAMGSVGGTLSFDENVKVIWVDAHADFNSPKTSPSGNVHGMPLSFLTGQFKHPATDRYLHWMPKLKTKNIAMIGLRELDAEEPKILKNCGILHFSVADVRKMGNGKCIGPHY